MTDFEELKEICRRACHERNACRDGFAALMQSENIAQMMQVWRDNWRDLYESKYADILPQHIGEAYARFGDEMRAAGIRVNEDAGDGMLIVADPGRPVRAYGTADCYVFGTAEVTGTDNATVHARSEGAKIVLTGHAQGYLKAGSAEVREFAGVSGTFDGECHQAAYVILKGGTLRDYGHLEISAWNDAVVYSNTRKKISLNGDARWLPLSEYNKKEEV